MSRFNEKAMQSIQRSADRLAEIAHIDWEISEDEEEIIVRGIGDPFDEPCVFTHPNSLRAFFDGFYAGYEMARQDYGGDASVSISCYKTRAYQGSEMQS